MSPSRPATRAARRLPARTRLAVAAGRAAATLSRRCGLGGGGIIGGRVSLLLDPHVLGHLAAGRRVVLVTGTNGKTTTALMLAKALRTLGPVAANSDGANLPDGVAAALAARPDAPYAVLEVDETYLPSVARQTHPAAIVLLNLSRDQLDRVGEVRSTERDLRAAFTENPGAAVIANADDVLVASAALAAARPVWISPGPGWRGDALSCPRCGNAVLHDGDHWSCPCGLRRPPPHWVLAGSELHGPDGRMALDLRLPGAVNLVNAAFAIAAAHEAGVPVPHAARAVESIEAVAGRYRLIRDGARSVRLLLAKNPAGWRETLRLLGTHRPVVIAVNGREADGRDLSWLWDVEFERLRGRPIVASGERAADLAVRLRYADLPHRVEPDPVRAVAGFAAGTVEVVANYTAFRELNARADHD
ncbi:DUF1727 domain-containing protein [Amycolatopsis acidicola]|uniref:Lipid II isoglutaminyl synthase (glutamine-hydrolyzing) subunit MurT n=1 Tax=Amycolatopsis acidicola TaxID=2596893 RepID=A0A5N0UMP0_9PSEU|nr:DUF1727 domain-containing protein [Amycolatopsis acidicola]